MIKRTLQVKVLYSFDPNVVTQQPHTSDSSTFGGMAQTGEDASLPQTHGQWTVRIEGMVCNNHEVLDLPLLCKRFVFYSFESWCITLTCVANEKKIFEFFSQGRRRFG